MTKPNEIYQPQFGDLHGKPIVTWEKDGNIYTRRNLIPLYRSWLSSYRLDKHEPPAVFWESNGPAIVRALSYCHCAALVFDYVTDRKVGYRWICRNPDPAPTCPDRTSTDWFSLCHVYAAGGGSNDTLVTVTMPNEEDVIFQFHPESMKPWLKPVAADKEANP